MEPTPLPGGDDAGLLASDLLDAWPVLSPEERAEGFRLLAPGEAEELFVALDAREESQLLLELGRTERQLWLC